MKWDGVFQTLSNQAICVTGPSGAGKSTFALALAHCLHCAVLDLDRYFLDECAVRKERVASKRRLPQWESPAAVDFLRLENDLHKICSDQPCMIPCYSFTENRRVSEEPFKLNGKGLIVEGLHSFRIGPILKSVGWRCLKIYLDVDLEKREGSIYERDVKDRGKSAHENAERMELLRKGEAKWIVTQKEMADLILLRSI